MNAATLTAQAKPGPKCINWLSETNGIIENNIVYVNRKRKRNQYGAHLSILWLQVGH
jgi:hypothetical protein